MIKKIEEIPTIYLAGGMEHAGPYGAEWRRDMTPFLEQSGYEVWDPYLQEPNVGVNVKTLSKMKSDNYELFLTYVRKIVDYDINTLKDCAAVAVRIDQSVLDGAGTYGELTLCRVYNIPVYAWIDLPRGKLDVPAWAMGCVTSYTYERNKFYQMIPSVDVVRGEHN